MPVFKKILEARKKIGAISKKQKTGIPYQYQGIEEVMHSFKQVFDEIELLFLPSNISVELVGDSWVLGYEMTFVDPDDDSQWVSRWGATMPVEEYRKDKPNLIDEKATGKAHSYAVKYFLMKTFMVTDKEDSANDVDGQPSQPAQPRKPANTQPLPTAPSTKHQRQQIGMLCDDIWEKEAKAKREETIKLMTNEAASSSTHLDMALANQYIKLLQCTFWGYTIYGIDGWDTEKAELAAQTYSKKRVKQIWLLDDAETDELHKEMAKRIRTYNEEMAKQEQKVQ